MTETTEPAPAGAAESADRPPTHWIEFLLAAGWLLLPALQYLGAVQRTRLQFEGTTDLPAFAVLDLTPEYLILLAATLGLAAIRAVRRRAGSVDGSRRRSL